MARAASHKPPRTRRGDAAAPAVAPAAAPLARLAGVDALRGFAMVVMALDHVRDYFTEAEFAPEDLALTTPAYFATRWVTHLAAPIFFLLAGTAAYFAGARRTRRELTMFLLKRGLFLVLLELTVVNVAWWFQLPMPVVVAAVIWALGWSMVALAGLVWLPQRAIAAFAVGMIALHNLLDGLPSAAFGALQPLWSVLHEAFVFYPVAGGTSLMIQYSLIPWIGVMAAGYALGPVFTWEKARRDAFLARLGAGLVGAFVLLRLLNVYGDPAPWSAQGDAVTTVLSFLNVTKYPASLLFLCATLGPALLLLPALERLRGFALEALTAYGRAPMFYYLTHLYLIHALAVAAGVLSGYPAAAMATSFPFLPEGYGWDLVAVYVLWIGVVLALLPATRWWGDLKQRRKDLRWLSYL